MSAAFAVTLLGGCNSKSPESALKSAVKVLNDAKSIEAEVEMSGTVSVTAGTESEDVKMSVNMKETMFLDPLKAKIETVTTTDDVTMTNTVQSYIAQEGEDYVSYSQIYGIWSKTKLGKVEEVKNQLSSVDFTQWLPDLSKFKYTKEENQKEGDKEYYIFKYSLPGDSFKSLLQGAMGSGGSLDSLIGQGNEEQELMEDISDKIGNLNMTIWVDPKDERIYKIEAPLTDVMNSVFDAIIDYLKEEAGDEAEAIPSDIGIHVTDMNMVMKYTKVNDVPDFDIPEEALNAADIDDIGDMDLDDYLEDGSEDEE